MEPQSANPTNKKRVLMIDDEEALAEALCHILRKQYDAQYTTSGKKGLELLLGTETFDVIICDLALPDLHGMDLYQAVQASKPGEEQKFIFFTGGVFTESTQNFIGSIPNPVLEKPVAIAVLRAKIEELIGRSLPR
jgi:DNA-binding response OmpR family regulator